MYCRKCGNILNDNDKFCGKCGSVQRLENNQKNFDKIKNLNTINAIIEFIIAGLFGMAALYVCCLFMGLIVLPSSGASGLFLLGLPIMFIVAIGFLILGIFNIKANKKMNISNMEVISIVEIFVGLIVFPYGIAIIIISILKIILLSKLKKQINY